MVRNMTDEKKAWKKYKKNRRPTLNGFYEVIGEECFKEGAKFKRTCLKPLRNAYKRLYDSHHEQLSNEALENRKEKVLKEVRKLFE